MAKHKYKKKLRHGNCAYCGVYSDELSEDHVIPQCLFSGRPPRDTPAVYACKECNTRQKSLGDTYLRDFLITDLANSGRPVLPSLHEAFERAKENNQSQFSRDVRLRAMPDHAPGGLFRGFSVFESVPSEPMKAILRTTVRGLYRAYTQKWLPDKIPVEVFRITNPAHINPLVQELSQRGGKYVAAGDGNVFECLYGIAKELPTESIWWLSFYRHSVFCVATNREHLLEGLASA